MISEFGLIPDLFLICSCCSRSRSVSWTVVYVRPGGWDASLFSIPLAPLTETVRLARGLSAAPRRTPCSQIYCRLYFASGSNRIETLLRIK